MTTWWNHATHFPTHSFAAISIVYEKSYKILKNLTCRYSQRQRIELHYNKLLFRRCHNSYFSPSRKAIRWVHSVNSSFFYMPVSEPFNVKVRFLVAALSITLLFLYHTMKVWLMVLLVHLNVTVRPSKSSEMNQSTNLTSVDATKPNPNENTFLGSVFML